MKRIHNISAGAGAGKTTKLVEIICGLLAGKWPGYKCTPDRMILTTFTDAAASEFRERVKQSLFAAGLNDEAVAVDAAQMGTVHSIAESYIRRYWYLLDMSPDLSPITESDANRLLSQALLDQVSPDDVSFFHKYAEDVSIRDISGRTNYDYWMEYFISIADLCRGGILSENEVEGWGNRSVEMLEKTFKPAYDPSSFRKVADAYLTYCDNDNIINSSSQAKAGRQAWLLRRIKEKGTLTMADRNSFNGSDWKGPFGVKKDYKGQVQDAFDDLTDYIDEVIPSDAGNIAEIVKRITRITKDGLSAYAEAKRQAGVIDFGDMESCFLRLLGHEAVCNDIKSSVDYLFVDEFQDSNPIQIRIFEKLSDLVKQSWFVGDMKQAIYGFRGSDTELVADFSRKFPPYERVEGSLIPSKQNAEGLSSEILDISYRSVPELVTFANRVFTEAFSTPFVRMDGTGKEIFRYDKEVLDKQQVELKPKRPSMGGPALFHVNLKSEGKALPYGALASFICTLLNGDYEPLKGMGIKPSDIAVLTRSNRHASAIGKAIRGKHVPVSVIDTDFNESIEVALLIDILRLVAGIQEGKTGAELRSIIDSLPLKAVLESLKEEDLDVPQWGGIRDFAKSLRRLSVVDVVDAVVVRFDLYDFASRWDNANLRRENIDLVKKIAQEFDKRCQVLGEAPDIRSFITFISSYKPDPKFNNLSEGVKVLTCHKAKGLDWKIVFLWEVSGSMPDKNMGVINGSYLIPHVPSSPWVNLCIEACPEASRIRNFLDAKALGEERRLLYVAATRAKDLLFTIGWDGKPLERIPDCCPGAPEIPVVSDGKAIVWGSGIDSVYVEAVDVPDLRYKNAPDHAEYPAKTGFLLDPLPIAREDKYRNPSKLEFPDVIVRARAEIVHEMKGRMDIRHPGLEDNEFGDCIHHIYAACRADAPEKSRAIASRTLVNWGVDDVSAPEKVAASYEELCAFLASKYGNAVSVGHEVPFVHQDAEGHVYSGVMDMLWETADGVVIVDFKTFGGNKAEALKESVQEHSSQLHEYREALSAANKKVLATVLHYPVTGVVIEVKD